jgi:hypothetical protein
MGRRPRSAAKANRRDSSKILISLYFDLVLIVFSQTQIPKRLMEHASSGSNWGSAPTGVRPEKGNSR